MSQSDLVTYSYNLGKDLLKNRSNETLKEQGQFLTPPSVARYMARQLGSIPDRACLLEPAVGSGALVCAVIEHLIAEHRPIELWIDAYETDAELCEQSRQVLNIACETAEGQGIKIHWQVYQEDFILSCIPETQTSFFGNIDNRRKSFDFIICNPPYFKLKKEDLRVKAVSGIVKGHTNIYTLFMAIGARLLNPQGRACYIVPRSFCSGDYFSAFRRELLLVTTPLAVHLFQSRQEVFKNDEILQENIVFSFEKLAQPKSQPYWTGFVNVSTSHSDVDLSETPFNRQIAFKHFLNPRNRGFFFRLPTGLLDEQILDAIDQWEGSLESFGLQVSTGPVVPFRAVDLLVERIPEGNGAVPLLWMQNIKPYKTEWPLANLGKPQAISVRQTDLLVPNANYVLLRRFSAKEDRRRLIAAPFLANNFPYTMVGIENHLNFIYRKKGLLQPDEALGLCAILNSPLIDRYFRIVNGNTQVNAAEIRSLALPPMEVIRSIGQKAEMIRNPTSELIDAIVYSVLWEKQLLNEDFPMIQETRITMGKIEQAQDILEALGLPAAQQNEMAALTLLVLAQLSEDSPWQSAMVRSLRVHDILSEIKVRYGREYAENTRETIRRHVLHQFEQAGIVIRNPEEPDLATNSPRTKYILSEIIQTVLQSYGTPEWENQRNRFISQRGALLEIYQKTREQNKVPLRVMDGRLYKLSPGKHNQLQAAIIEDFGPRYVPGAKVLYLGDAASKILIFETEVFSKLGVQVSDHGKLPDIVLYDENKNWLFLVEAVTSHGPVSPKRQFELEEMFKDCLAARIYVSAFLDFSTFKRFLNEIAWETEVWIAEMPYHLVHFNGDKFLGPRK